MSVHQYLLQPFCTKRQIDCLHFSNFEHAAAYVAWLSGKVEDNIQHVIYISEIADMFGQVMKVP